MRPEDILKGLNHIDDELIEAIANTPKVLHYIDMKSQILH